MLYPSDYFAICALRSQLNAVRFIGEHCFLYLSILFEIIVSIVRHVPFPFPFPFQDECSFTLWGHCSAATGSCSSHLNGFFRPCLTPHFHFADCRRPILYFDSFLSRNDRPFAVSGSSSAATARSDSFFHFPSCLCRLVSRGAVKAARCAIRFEGRPYVSAFD